MRTNHIALIVQSHSTIDSPTLTAIFAADATTGRWLPSRLAAGPFAGLQGGAVAGLLTAEIEAAAAENGWGQAVTAAAWFLRPTPMSPLRSELSVLRAGGRVAIVDNTLWADGADEPTATVRVTMMRGGPVEVPGWLGRRAEVIDPTTLPRAERRAPHGGPWFMDAMEARPGGETTWFRLKAEVVEGAGPLSRILGPADWAHGLSRPVNDVVADPNPNLTVQLLRPPRGDWIGVRSKTHWEPTTARGMGHGVLLDVDGEIGVVSMAVALTPFPPRP
jgi:acyl-coenzyme A thioesterase PaaI-like protein